MRISAKKLAEYMRKHGYSNSMDAPKAYLELYKETFGKTPPKGYCTDSMQFKVAKYL